MGLAFSRFVYVQLIKRNRNCYLISNSYKYQITMPFYLMGKATGSFILYLTDADF